MNALFLVQKELKVRECLNDSHLAWVMSNGNKLYIFSTFLLNQSKVKRCCKEEWDQSGIKLFCHRVISSSVFVSSGQTALASQTPQNHQEVGTKFHTHACSVMPAEQETEEKIDRIRKWRGLESKGGGRRARWGWQAWNCGKRKIITPQLWKLSWNPGREGRQIKIECGGEVWGSWKVCHLFVKASEVPPASLFPNILSKATSTHMSVLKKNPATCHLLSSSLVCSILFIAT